MPNHLQMPVVRSVVVCCLNNRPPMESDGLRPVRPAAILSVPAGVGGGFELQCPSVRQWGNDSKTGAPGSIAGNGIVARSVNCADSSAKNNLQNHSKERWLIPATLGTKLPDPPTAPAKLPWRVCPPSAVGGIGAEFPWGKALKGSSSTSHS